MNLSEWTSDHGYSQPCSFLVFYFCKRKLITTVVNIVHNFRNFVHVPKKIIANFLNICTQSVTVFALPKNDRMNFDFYCIDHALWIGPYLQVKTPTF